MMQDAATSSLHLWLGCPPRPRVVEDYVRKLPKVLRCKYEFASSLSPAKTTSGTSRHKRDKAIQNWIVRAQFENIPVQQSIAVQPRPIETRFHELADNWSQNTWHVSSITDLRAHPSYKKIIEMGWDVVPLLLRDLQQTHRFWFPALSEITKVRPFDPGDAGNVKRMSDAWIAWGKKKRLI